MDLPLVAWDRDMKNTRWRLFLDGVAGRRQPDRASCWVGNDLEGGKCGYGWLGPCGLEIPGLLRQVRRVVTRSKIDRVL